MTLVKRRFFKKSMWAAAALSGWAMFLMGQARSDRNIALVDVMGITAGSSTIQAAIAQVSTTSRKLSEDLKARQDLFEGVMRTYETQKGVVTEEKNKERLAAAERLRGEINTLSAQLKGEIEKAQKALPGMEKKVQEAVAAVAAARGCAIVFSADSAVYHDPETDLTAAVISRLDGGK